MALTNNPEQLAEYEERMVAYMDTIELMVVLKIATKELFHLINLRSDNRVPTEERTAAHNQIFSKAAQFERLINQLIVMRRLFITREKKYLGLGSESLQIGDEVWVLQRANTPVVLRKLPNGHYMVVGPAYVHGIMKGEAVAERLDAIEDVILD
jgi:hypothetical protein